MTSLPLRIAGLDGSVSQASLVAGAILSVLWPGA